MNLWIVSGVTSNNNADFATFCIIETMGKSVPLWCTLTTPKIIVDHQTLQLLKPGRLCD